MADTELRTATELDGSTGFELADTDIIPITKAAALSGLFKVTLATLKDYFLAGVGAVPPGGTTGQVLTKASGTDGDVDWETPSGGGGSGLLAFVNFSYSGGVVTINKQHNVASVTRSAQGVYQVTYTTALDDAYYQVSGSGRFSDFNDNNFLRAGPDRHSGKVQSTTVCDFRTLEASTLTAYDPETTFSLSIIG